MPLPPNRTGEFLASGSPVSVLVVEIGALIFRLRLRRSTQRARCRHRPSASIDSSCEGSQQAFGPQSCFVTLPCLAIGTRGSLNCSSVFLALPPSYPPLLHDRYSLHRYYGGSDSCSAPSSTRTGILDSYSCTSGHSVSNHSMRLRSGNASCSGRTWPPLRLGG